MQRCLLLCVGRLYAETHCREQRVNTFNSVTSSNAIMSKRLNNATSLTRITGTRLDAFTERQAIIRSHRTCAGVTAQRAIQCHPQTPVNNVGIQTTEHCTSVRDFTAGGSVVQSIGTRAVHRSCLRPFAHQCCQSWLVVVAARLPLVLNRHEVWL